MTASLEDIKTFDVEEWLTLNTAASPTKLKLGQTPDAKNVWVDEKPGSVITANGFIKVGTNPSNNPTTFCIDYFKSSTGSQTFVCSDNSTVWTTTDFQTFTSIITGLSSSFQLRGMVIRDKLWLTNGSDAVRTFDGSSVVVLDGSGSTPNVPKGRYISYHDERVWMFHTSTNRSGAYFTALTDSSATIIPPDDGDAWPADNLLQVSEGDADFGTGMYLYRGYLHFFKQYSIWRLVGYDEYTYTKVKTRASTGTRFNESLQELDGLIHMVGTDGIYVFDGETTERISDIIDPAAVSQTAFGFTQLQQLTSNNQFWETTLSSEWNLGTVSRNLTVADSLAVMAADTTTADFNLGSMTRMTASDIADELRLTLSTSGVSSRNVALGIGGSLQPVSNTGTIGNAAFMTDGNLTNACGFSGSSNLSSGIFNLSLSTSLSLTRIVLKSVFSGNASMEIRHAGVAMSPSGVSSGLTIGPAPTQINFPPVSVPTDYTITFPAFTTTDLQLVMLVINRNTGFSLTEVQVFTAAYNSTGSFTSRALDLGTTPASAGYLNASYSIPSGTSATFYTQTSADGSSWDSAVLAISSGGSQGAIGSTPRRYIRWVVNLVSEGQDTPAITSVNLPATFISPVHNTGGSIFSWGPLESDYFQAGLPIQFYVRTATTSVGVASATWNLIVPGAVISDSVSNAFIQFKIEFSGMIDTPPTVNNVTVNWIVGTGTQPQTQQNIASAVWRNRYWMSAANAGSVENDIIIIRGKKTFGSPWQLKDWQIISFTKFQSNFYGGSSIDGSIYRLDTGYSADGSSLDAYFETGDLTSSGFFINLTEILIEVQRLGSYSLTVGTSIDRGVTWSDKTVDLTVTGAASYFKRININVAGDCIRLRVRIDAADQPFEVHRLTAFYTVSKARGSLN